MNMEYLSIYLYLLWFPSSIVHSLQCASLSFSSLVKLIPKYLLTFDSVVNYIVFWIYFQIVNCKYISKLIYLLILYPALFTEFIGFNRFLWNVLRSSTCKIILSTNRDNFTSSLSYLDVFYASQFSISKYITKCFNYFKAI